MKKTSSISILKNDFGNFPPAPLSLNNTQRHHDEVYIHHLYSPYGYYLRLIVSYSLYRTLLNKKLARKKLKELIKENGPIGKKVNHFISKNITELKLTRGTLSYKIFSWYKKIFKSNLVFFLFLTELISVFKRNKFDVYGFIIPLDNTRHLFLKNQKEKHITLGHEHIHLLQYNRQVLPLQSSNDFPRHLYRNSKFFQVSLLLPQYKDDYHHIRYLHEPVEIEARLHQFVIDVYHKFKVLPTSRDAFVYLFISSDYNYKGFIPESKDILNRIIDHGLDFIAEAIGVEALNNLKDTAIHGTSIKVCEDIKLLQRAIKPENLATFIFKDLSYFYARLISYYGDNELANKLIAENDDLSKYPLITA